MQFTLPVLQRLAVQFIEGTQWEHADSMALRSRSFFQLQLTLISVDFVYDDLVYLLREFPSLIEIEIGLVRTITNVPIVNNSLTTRFPPIPTN